MRILRPIAVVFSTLWLAACGGSSDGESATYPNAYIQMYNGSANSASTALTLTLDTTDTAVGSAAFADVTNLVSVNEQTYKLKLTYSADSTTVKTVKEDTVGLVTGQKTLLMMAGDFANPELLKLSFVRDDKLDDQFKVNMMNLVNNTTTYDVYIGDSTKTFADATLIGSAGYKTSTQFINKAVGSYILYVTKGGDKTVLFKSSAVSFSFETEFVLVLRSAVGPQKNKFAIDVIGNTTTVQTQEDLTSNAQFRVYNSINDINPGKIFLGDLTATPAFANVVPDTLTTYTETVPGDYRVSLADAQNNLVMRNGLVTLSQNAVKSIVFYRDANENAAAITVTDSKLPQVFDFVFNAVNVIPNYNQVSLYFVAPGQTMETTPYYVNTLNYASQTSVTLPAGEYTMFVVHKDTNNNKILLAQTELKTLVTGSNYLLVAEPDTFSLSGYKLSLNK
jgi:hypothetical protein